MPWHWPKGQCLNSWLWETGVQSGRGSCSRSQRYRDGFVVSVWFSGSCLSWTWGLFPHFSCKKMELRDHSVAYIRSHGQHMAEVRLEPQFVCIQNSRLLQNGASQTYSHHSTYTKQECLCSIPESTGRVLGVFLWSLVKFFYYLYFIVYNYSKKNKYWQRH